MSALELGAIHKTRGAGAQAVAALSDVSLRAEPGEVVLLHGPSGSGKTTLLAVAAGLLTPEKGRVSVAGRCLGSLDAGERRRLRARSIGLVFQHAHLLPGLTGLENVALQAMLAEMPAREARHRAHELLDRLGIGALAGRRPETLSGGEEQRLAVARALIHRPAVILADEPTASLDTVAGQQVADLLLRLGAAEGAAVLLATHDSRLAACATRRVRLLDGRIDASR